ncbi:MAG TPA: sugar phosphate isomerase/epimerase [Candidatus Paceibacterota bacterium]|nr:sugar phosphate isomerase/epimerase [Verrucomicrobiota bacterium]HSA11458.1 sugar phosphate isomerase/epimerase [Candidatus Paceibacterota bacterium]
MNALNRRDWLKLAGAAAVGLPLTSHAAPDLRAKARKNLKLGVFMGVYASLPLEEAARRIADDGFHGVVFESGFADVRFDPWAPDWDKARLITRTLARHHIQVVGLYGYYNVVDPNPDRRKRGEERMQVLIDNWKQLGSPVITTETGTFNEKSEWAESPENATEQGYQACRAALEKLVRAAKRTGAVLTIETYWRNVIDSIARAERILRDVPELKLTMDPCNYFRKEELPRMDPMLEEMFRVLGRKIVLAHAKDVKASASGTDLPAAGTGVLNYPLYLRLLAGLNRELFLVLEHLTLPDVPRARDYVLSQFALI